MRAIEHLTRVFDDQTSFRAKGSPDALQIAILPQFLAIEPHFVRKGCARTREIAILPQFLAIEPHFVRKGCDGNPQIAILPQAVFGDRTSFRAKGLRPDKRNRNFTAVVVDRTSFRAKGLRFVPSRWHCFAPSREK